MLATALGTAYAVLSVTPVITKIGNGARAITCPERLTSTFGHVQSENGDYANGEQVCWLIAPTEKPSEITLSFHKFDVEQYYDALFVFDGDSVVAEHYDESSGAHLSIEALLAAAGAA